MSLGCEKFLLLILFQDGKKKLLSFSMGYESHFLMDESLYRVGVVSEILWALIPDPSKH